MSAAPLTAKTDDTCRNMGSTKLLRWANPFREALKKTPPPVPTARHVPEGTRVYCVGDIHGRDDLLRDMAERVEADMEVRSFDRAVTIFLGDYVDRGLGSMQVVERLARSEWPTPMIALAGNHEDFLMGFLADGSLLELWRDFGGLETLHSYGVDVGRAIAGRDFRAVQAAFAVPVARISSALFRDAQGFNDHRRLLLLSRRSKTGRAAGSSRSR